MRNSSRAGGCRYSMSRQFGTRKLCYSLATPYQMQTIPRAWREFEFSAWIFTEVWLLFPKTYYCYLLQIICICSIEGMTAGHISTTRISQPFPLQCCMAAGIGIRNETFCPFSSSSLSPLRKGWEKRAHAARRFRPLLQKCHICKRPWEEARNACCDCGTKS